MELVLTIAFPTILLTLVVGGLSLWARQGRDDNAAMIEDYGGTDTTTGQPGFGATNPPGGGLGG